MTSDTNALKRFVHDENGMESLEYAIIAGLIVAGSLVAIAAIGVWVAGVYTGVQTAIGA